MSPATRRVTALAVGMVVATLLLGGGWLRATFRDRAGRLGEARVRLERRADLVRGAVDESLEELRAREDERPFYLYNHYYSPPDVLAISDPVATSPLARTPTDARVVGHFQLEPGERVRTPYSADERAPTPLEERIVEALEDPRFDDLRALTGGEGPTVLRPHGLRRETLGERGPRGAPAQDETTTGERGYAAHTRGVFETATPVPDQASPPTPDEPPTRDTSTVTAIDRAQAPEATRAPRGDAAGNALGAEQDDERRLPSVGHPEVRGRRDAASLRTEEVEGQPLTLALNAWGNQQAQEIVAAQQGDQEANMRLLERGRQVPRIARRDVEWAEVDPPSTAPRDRRNAGARRRGRTPSQVVTPPALMLARPAITAVRDALDTLAEEITRCSPTEGVVARLRVRGRDGLPETVQVEGVTDDAQERCAREVLQRFRVEPFTAPVAIVRYAFSPPGAEPGVTPAPPEITDASGLDNMVQRETEVTYTPMVFREEEGTLVLHRVVSHQGVSVVQGVLLDRARLVTSWIPALVARHAGDEQPALTVVYGEGTECEVRRPASARLAGVDLCFAPGALRGATETLDVELRWQVAGLIGLWLIALLAAYAIVSAARRAEALSKQKSAFVSAVSHELRTPLTTLRMHAEMLEEGMVTDARRPKVHRELVRESVRLARLVDNVLSISQLEEGRRGVQLTEADLAAHVHEVVENQRAFVEERGFRLESPSAAELRTAFDRQAVEQIVVNLIDNALKYADGDDPSIEVRVTSEHGTPVIRVLDRGPGVPETERERVFERFHRVEREEHAHAPGTGIGLALVRELAEAHGGQASAHERDGGGLELRVTLGPSK